MKRKDRSIDIDLEKVSSGTKENLLKKNSSGFIYLEMSYIYICPIQTVYIYILREWNK